MRRAWILPVTLLTFAVVAAPTATPLGAKPCEPLSDPDARRLYALEPGFVDLFIDDEARFAVAVFDLDARPEGSPLPAPLPIGAGYESRVEGIRAEPLIAAEAPADDPPLIPGPCYQRIGPGAAVGTPVGGCSANFVFTDAQGRYYVGTAGHCFSAVGQRMTAGGLGEVGTAVYRISQGIGNDFALVRIDESKYSRIRPDMCHWGGPTELQASGAGLVRHYGFGVLWGNADLYRPRTGFVFNSAGDSFGAWGTVTSGDSGSGARYDTGGTLGVITHVNLPAVFFATSAPDFYGTRLPHAIALAEQGTGLDLTLVTASVA